MGQQVAIFGVSVEKDVDFRGGRERISNTYFYECGTGMQVEQFEALGDKVVAAEREVHAPGVTFKLIRVWSAGGTKEQNQMVLIKDIDLNGTMSAPVTVAAELAVLVSFECARRNRLGRKVYLRKYIRPQGLPVNQAGAVIQREAINSAGLAVFKTFADDIESFSAGVAGPLCALVSETGNFPRNVGNATVNPHLRNRNIKR